MPPDLELRLGGSVFNNRTYVFRILKRNNGGCGSPDIPNPSRSQSTMLLSESLDVHSLAYPHKMKNDSRWQ